MKTTPIYGMMAEFDSASDLVAAARKTHEAGYKKIDAYSPFPVEELAEAIGFQVRGTVGLILRGWQRKQITKTEAAGLLRLLPSKSSLHLRPGFLARVLEQLN